MSKNEVVIPAYLAAMMDKGEAKNDIASSDVASGGVPRLTTKGKTFRFKQGEDEVKAGQSVDLIIVGMSPERGLAHTYYADGYTPDASSPPDCSSGNGVNPDNWVENPEANLCAKCPQAVWGSAVSMSGGKAKACKDSKHLYVARAEDFTKNPEEATLYILSVTVNSLKAFANYGKEIAKIGLPSMCFAITRVIFDDEASVPKLEFEMLGLLNKELGTVSNARNKEAEWDNGLSLPPPTGTNKRALPTPAASADEVIEDAIMDANADVTSDDLLEQW